MNLLLGLEQSAMAEGREWTRRYLERTTQNEINQWGSLCPESGQPLLKRKAQRLRLTTCAGDIVLKSWRGYSPAQGRWINPARQRFGLQARRRGLGRARKVYIVIDGAVWLWNRVADRFAEATCLLDFHHASQHLWAIAHQRYGESTPEARSWVEPRLHQLRHGKEQKVIRQLEELLTPSSTPSAELRAELQPPVAYFQNHREHLAYQAVERENAPVGSGAVESFNSQLQNRFKRTGQFWTRPGLTHLLYLDVLLRNEDYDLLWN